MATQLMVKADRAALYQIVRDDTNYLRAATHVVDGDLQQLCGVLGEEQFRCIYLVPEGSAEPRSKSGSKGFAFRDFEIFVRACFERRHMAMFIDEAHMLCDPRFIPTYLWESVVTGRHKYLDIVYITQRFSMVHRDITANTHEFYFWQIIEPSDLDSIAQRCGDEVAHRVSLLARTEDNRRNGGELVPGEVVHWIA